MRTECAEQANPAIKVRASNAEGFEGESTPSPLNLLGENGRARRKPQPRPEGRAGAAPNSDDHVAIAAVWRRRIASNVQADLPDKFWHERKFAPFGYSSMSHLHPQISSEAA